MPKLLEARFWFDSSDPHGMAAVMQVASRPMRYDYATVSGDWRYTFVGTENVWGKAVHRVATLRSEGGLGACEQHRPCQLLARGGTLDLSLPMTRMRW